MTLRLASPFQDHAVLQRDQTLPVWGWAAPMTRVRVTLAGHEAHTLSNNHGDWSVRLPALPAGGPHVLVVEAGGETLSISDLLVGEVWIASGQSNMEWSVNGTFDKAIDIPASARLPMIRHIKIKKTVADEPASTVAIDRRVVPSGMEKTERTDSRALTEQSSVPAMYTGPAMVFGIPITTVRPSPPYTPAISPSMNPSNQTSPSTMPSALRRR